MTKSPMSSMTLRGAALLVIGFLVQLGTMAGYISADDGALINDKAGQIIGGLIDVTGIIMVVWGRVRAGGLALKVIPFLLPVLLAASLSACAGLGEASTSSQLYASCRTYASLERTIIVQYMQGRLKDEQIDLVNTVAPGARALCRKPVGEPVTTDMLREIEEAILKLQTVKGTTP
jgi:hypothetical protein